MSRRNLIFAASVALMTGALFGYSVGFIGGVIVLPSFLRHFNLEGVTADKLASARAGAVTSWVVGGLLGVPLAMPVCSKYGRKATLFLSASLYLAGAVLQLVSPGASLPMFDVGRVLNGLGVGAGTLVSPIYVSEISTPELRGTFMSTYQVLLQLGALIGFWAAYAMNATIEDSSDLQWQIPVLLQLVPSSLLFFGTFLIPETPHYLAAVSTMEKVQESVAWLNQLPPNDFKVVVDAKQIRDEVLAGIRKKEERSGNFLKEAWSKPIRKRLTVGCGLMVAQNMIGLNALNYYTAVIFFTAGFRSVSSSLFLTGIFGLVKLIAAMLFTFVFVRVRGNRFWLLLGSGVCTICMFILGYCVVTMGQSDGPAGEDGAVTVRGAVSVLMVYVFSLFFGISLGPISWNVCAEIFPTHINDKCCTITTCAQWIWHIVITSITPFLIAAIGGLTFVLYGVFGALAFLFCMFFVPETRGVPLGKPMEALFESKPKMGADDSAIAEEVEDVDEEDEEVPLLIKPVLSERDKRRRRSSVAMMI